MDKSTKTSGNLIYQASDFDWQGAYCKEVHRRFTHYPSLIPKPSDKLVWEWFYIKLVFFSKN